MEKLKIKHDHKLTDILKVGIFCLFLILPILLFLPNCLYYGFNEHATNTETTTINYKYQSNKVNSLNDLVLGNIYHVDEFILTGAIDDTFYINIYYCESIEVQNSNHNIDEISLVDYDSNEYNCIGVNHGSIDDSTLYFTNDNCYVGLVYDFSNSGYIIFSNIVFSVTDFLNNFIDYANYIQMDMPTYTDYNVIESVDVNTDNTITTQIGNSWASLWQTPFLQWTDNNNFQFTVNAFTNVFGITEESYITNYLTYILTMTCIYLVFDIVISISTKLTHMLTNSKD